MTAKELRSKKAADLNGYVEKWRLELAKLKLQAAVGQCQKSSRIVQIKRDIARVHTIFREQVREQELLNVTGNS